MKKTYTDFGKVVVGHSRDIQPNEAWEEQGLLCQWEHCVETMPPGTSYYVKTECPVFKHLCPGDADQVSRCRNIANVLWKKIEERFK